VFLNLVLITTLGLPDPAADTSSPFRHDKETIMRAPPGQMTRPKLPALLGDGTLAGEWDLDPRRSSVRLKAKTMGLIAVNGVIRKSPSPRPTA
jgi:hypothetical protein